MTWQRACSETLVWCRLLPLKRLNRGENGENYERCISLTLVLVFQCHVQAWLLTFPEVTDVVNDDTSHPHDEKVEWNASVFVKRVAVQCFLAAGLNVCSIIKQQPTSGIKMCGLQFWANIRLNNTINQEITTNTSMLQRNLQVLGLLPQWSSITATEHLLRAGNLKDGVITAVSQSQSAWDGSREGPVMFT